ncbi:acyltransferase [Pseudomonas sp. gcc21]|uniref:acyltransferase family protein n=1 Tax=Pseudomonas sp. gcc21 TaxID=2726989 RepID=UPI0014527925|nr:acyltransferase family protein [Pseudomonas sp. gcc21]QJD57705.1 acyltransferase [Pseudomonas sp. gcc21]
MEFRRDINGLRAVAVVLVVLFHFGLLGMGGGFIGVDVFFVISGFLMTGIIYSRMEKNTFTIPRFYLDRCRRIVPALAFVCLFLLIVGWFLLLPRDYEALGKEVLGSLAFISNILFWKQAGYFEQASHDQWLLHTWSLSVEWQFYLIYPVLIVALRQVVSASNTRWFLWALALFSFALSVYASGKWPTSAFFLLPTRMWEMLAGSLIYLYPLTVGRRTGKTMEVAGLGIIVVCAISFSGSTQWPGWLAALPVFGAVLVIASSQSESLITGNPVAQFLGKTSYSLYLWHWPIAVWLYYFGLEHDMRWVLFAVGASVVAGWLSFTFIEGMAGKKPRYAPALKPRAIIGAPVAAACALASITFVANGFPDRMSEEFRRTTADLVMPWKQSGWCFHSVETFPELEVGKAGLGCELGDRSARVNGLLFGDSFAGHYDPFWDDIGQHISMKIDSVSTDWCYPSLTGEYTGPYTGRGYQQCLYNRKYLVDNLADYDFVVFAGQWGAVHAKQQMQGVFDAIAMAAEKSELVILMPAPTNFDVNVKNMYQRSLLFDTSFDISRFHKQRDESARAANQALSELASQFANVLYFDRDALFHVDGVPSDVTRDNIPFSLDESGHISVYGAKMAARAFRQSSLFAEFADMATGGRPSEIPERRYVGK